MIPNLQIPNWESNAEDFDTSDNFRMFHFKIKECPRARSHDWTVCPYAHPAEKARRRDPLKFRYSGTACPDYRKGICRKGDTCPFAHGVFECWLHPSRYRTQLCKDGDACRRRVCFFAHGADQLRHVTHGSASPVSSPTSVLSSSFPDSPPASPYAVVPLSVREIISSMQNVRLKEAVSSSGLTRDVFGSPRGAFLCLNGCDCEEEPVMERVESGRDLRAKMYAKLRRENYIGPGPGPGPDIGWVSELVK